MSPRATSRAAAAAAAVENPLARSLTRLEPRDGLVIDAEAWELAHRYHADQAQAHNLAAHGAGVIAGLEVLPAGGREIAVLPGVGVDPNGRFLVITTPTRVTVDAAQGQLGAAYVVLQRIEPDPDQDGRVREETTVQVVRSVPDGPYLELARIELGAQASIGLPEDDRQPQAGEIDLRYRTDAGGHARGAVTIAELRFSDAGEGHPGAAALLARSINTVGAYRARYVGTVHPGDQGLDADILYATGTREFTVNDGAVSWLKNFLDGGGCLIGDGCHSVPADPFGGAFDKLGRSLGRQLKRVVAGDRLLLAHYVFGAPPPGLVKTDVGMILAEGGVIYCASDYGCILSGGGETPASREAIRAVEEFATNLAASARERAGGRSFLQ